MRHFILIGSASLLLTGCQSTSIVNDNPRVYASPAEAVIYEFTNGQTDKLDLKATAALIESKNEGHRFDLNGDGADECLIAATHFVLSDGTVHDLSPYGSGKHYLLHQTGSGWVVLNEFYADYYQYELTDVRTDGWLDISTQTDSVMTNGLVHRYYQWGGAAYREGRDTRSHYATPAEAYAYEIAKLYTGIDREATAVFLENLDVGRMIDLNGDGIDECIVTSEHQILSTGMVGIMWSSGVGNFDHFVLRRNGNGWSVIGRIAGGSNLYEIKVTRTEGWHDIKIFYLTGFDPTPLEYRWDGSAYTINRPALSLPR